MSLAEPIFQKLTAVLATLTIGVGVSACSSDAGTIAAQARSGDVKGFVSGDGTIERLGLDQRLTPLTLSGTTLQGAPWKVADAADKVLVLNVWGSWCGPCVAEMPHLQQVWSQMSTAGGPVQFMGVNYRDGAETAKAFLRANKVTYPSLEDDGGRTLLALRGKA